jgi:pimeloyl-ACP methyl ester carboxylesterase
VTVRAGDIDFDVADTGSGDPAIVLIHGLACDATAWEPQVADLSRDHRCVVVNLRGRGATPATPPYEVGQQAADVAAILDTLGVTGAIVVGHSLGGIVTLVLNDARPDLVGGTVYVDSPLRSGGFDASGFATAVRQAGNTSPAAPLVESFWGEVTTDPIREQVRTMMLGCPHEVVAGMVDNQMSAERMLELVRAADTKPMMAIWPDKPIGEPAWLRDVTLFLRQEPVPGTGHFLQLEEPAITNALLRSFVEEAVRDPRIAS